MSPEEYGQSLGVPAMQPGGNPINQTIAGYREQANILPSIISEVEKRYKQNPSSFDPRELEYFNTMSKQVLGRGLAGYSAEATLDDALYGFTNSLLFNAPEALGVGKALGMSESELTDAERRARGIGSGLGFAAGLAVPIAGGFRAVQGAAKGAGLLSRMAQGAKKVHDIEKGLFVGKTALGTAAKGAGAGAVFGGLGSVRDEYGDVNLEDGVYGALGGAAVGGVLGGVGHKLGPAISSRMNSVPDEVLTKSGALKADKGMAVEDFLGRMNKYPEASAKRIEGMLKGGKLDGFNLEVRNNLAGKLADDLTDVERAFLDAANKAEEAGVIAKRASTMSKMSDLDADSAVALMDMSEDSQKSVLKLVKGMSNTERSYFLGRVKKLPEAERADYIRRAATEGSLERRAIDKTRGRREVAKKIEDLVPLRKGRTPISRIEESSMATIADSIKAKKIKQADVEYVMENLTAAQQRRALAKIAKGETPEDVLSPLLAAGKLKDRVARYADYGGKSPAAQKSLERQISTIVTKMTDAEEKALVKAKTRVGKLKVVRDVKRRLADLKKGTPSTPSPAPAVPDATPSPGSSIDFTYDYNSSATRYPGEDLIPDGTVNL